MTNRIEEKIGNYLNEKFEFDERNRKKMLRQVKDLKDKVENFGDKWTKQIEDRDITKKLKDKEEDVHSNLDEMIDILNELFKK